MIKPIKAANLTAIPGLRHGFFTREGGTSEGIYASLNVGLGSHDCETKVIENRSRVAAHLGHAGQPLNTLHQSHTADVIVIDRPFDGSPPRADGLVTRSRGAIIGALAADCTPVLFADPEAAVIGAAHAGWRGALGGILEATIGAMVSVGAEVGRIRAAIGPTISQENYEVGPEFEQVFINHDSKNARFFKQPTPGVRPHFDLPGYVFARLHNSGVRDIECQTQCTYENESCFFSYRRSIHRSEPDYGRQISAIVLD